MDKHFYIFQYHHLSTKIFFPTLLNIQNNKILNFLLDQHQLIYQKAKHIFMNISKEYSNLLHVYTKK